MCQALFCVHKEVAPALVSTGASTYLPNALPTYLGQDDLLVCDVRVLVEDRESLFSVPGRAENVDLVLADGIAICILRLNEDIQRLRASTTVRLSLLFSHVASPFIRYEIDITRKSGWCQRLF